MPANTPQGDPPFPVRGGGCLLPWERADRLEERRERRRLEAAHRRLLDHARRTRHGRRVLRDDDFETSCETGP